MYIETPGFDSPIMQASSTLERRSVPCLSLCDILNQNSLNGCDLLKMDWEGSEYEILSAAPVERLARIGTVILEYHANVRVEELVSLLRGAHFRVELDPEYRLLLAHQDRQA